MDSPFLTTAEAATYCGFKTAAGLRKARMLGRVAAWGRRGGRGTLMWRREDLDAFLAGKAPENGNLKVVARERPEERDEHG
jgi:hypothetical protein